MDCWPSLCSRSEWERRFAAAGLAVEQVHTIASRTHAQIWDIGLRPLAPLLVRMANGLTRRDRSAIKRDWIELCLDLLAPMCRFDFDLFPGDHKPAELQYVLKPT
jgi:hypothetical protein